MTHDPATVSAVAPRERRLAIIAAGNRKNPDDLSSLRDALHDEDAFVRVAALGALAKRDSLTAVHVISALRDLSPEVRQRAAQTAKYVQGETETTALNDALRESLHDSIPLCVVSSLEALALREDTDSVEAIGRLVASHPDPLVVEEAVAALAEIGDVRGLPLILEAAEGKPALRRRVVAALGAFEGDEVEATLDRLEKDRDWQVRQAVAMLRRVESEETD